MLKQITDFLKSLWDKTIGKLTKGQRIRFLIGAVLFVSLVYFLITFLTRTQYGVLYADMNPVDTGEIYTELKARAVDAKVEGNSILVPLEQVDTLRVELMASGYPKSGQTYELLQQATGLGVTDAERQVWFRLQLQENLRQTISKMEKVKDASVLITLAPDSPFLLSAKKDATAGIVLELRGTTSLTSEEAINLGEFVTKSVPNLTLENVRIIDSQMHLYELDQNSTLLTAANNLALQEQVEKKLRDQVLRILVPIFGVEGVNCEVKTEMDFDRTLTTETIFTPPVAGSEEGVAVSLRELTETVRNYQQGGETGTGENGFTPSYPTVSDDEALYSQVSKEINYELNETVNQIERAQGTVKSLTVSIVLDSQSEMEDFSDAVRRTVANALNTPEATINVERMPIIKADPADVQAIKDAQAEELRAIQRARLVRLIIVVGGVLVLVAMLLMFGRSIARTLRKADPQLALAGAGGAGGIDYLADEDLASVTDFRTKRDSTAESIDKYIQTDPAAVASLLRTWLSEEYR